MKNRSKINKGLRLDNYIVELMRETLDKDAYRVAGSGSGKDKNDVRLPNWNIEIENKNHNTFKTKSGWEQVERQLTSGNIGALVSRHPDYKEFEKVLITLDINDFIELLNRNASVEVAQELPKDLLWVAKRAKDSAHELAKKLNDYNLD